jgi:PAS domain-containing protein
MSSPALSRHRSFARPVHASADGRGVAPPISQVADPSDEAGAVTGRYRYDSRGDAWWWSPEMFALYGLPPGAAEPCTQLMLQSLHPGDRARTLQALTRARSGSAFALENRVLRPDGAVRTIVVIGEPQVTGDGDVSAVEGLCIDLTDGRQGTEADRVHALETEVSQLRTAMASRAAIEQAKGILMLLTSCGDQVAFDLLAHISSHTHRKVREVAVAITESASGNGGLPDDIRSILRDACPPSRAY